MRTLTILIGLALCLSISVFGQTTGSNSTTQANGTVKTGKVDASASGSQQTDVKTSKNGKSTNVNSNANQNTSANANVGNKSLNLDSGSQLNAVLNSSLDTKHAESGQRFTMKTTKDVKSHGQTVIKKGSTLVGHVVDAQSKAEGNGSSNLLLAIDGVQPQGGGDLIPLQATFVGMVSQTIQAASDMDMGAPTPMPSAPRSGGGGGGLLGGVGGAVNSTVNTTTQTAGNVTSGVGGANATGTVTKSVNSTVNGTVNGVGNVAGGGAVNGASQTLFSLGNGVTASTSNTVQGATQFSRRGGDLKLDKGSEFLLSVVSNSQASGSVQK